VARSRPVPAPVAPRQMLPPPTTTATCTPRSLTAWATSSAMRFIIATASTANQDLLKQLGADVAVDYTKTRFEDVAKNVDAVLDPVGKETLARSYGAVKKGGIVMCLVALPDRAELQKRGIHGAAISVNPQMSTTHRLPITGHFLTDVALIWKTGACQHLTMEETGGAR